MKGQLALGRELYPLVGAKFAVADEFVTALSLEKSVPKTELREIFWANFFGPAYVKKYGRKFFLEAPGWKKEELSDGGILYVVSKSFLSWWKNNPKTFWSISASKFPA